MTIRSCASQAQRPISAQAHIAQRCEAAQAACRSQNRLHVQQALMEYLLPGRIG